MGARLPAQFSSSVRFACSRQPRAQTETAGSEASRRDSFFHTITGLRVIDMNEPAGFLAPNEGDRPRFAILDGFFDF